LLRGIQGGHEEELPIGMTQVGDRDYPVTQVDSNTDLAKSPTGKANLTVNQ
jgi:hypothetical protein